MPTQVTNQIKITVEPLFMAEYSNPLEDKFLFSYTVRITNMREGPVQLMARRWMIHDSNREVREVQGTGVIGEQPTILPNETHVYSSWCDLTGPVGFMVGHYLMLDLEVKEQLLIEIPRFDMVYPGLLN